MVTGTTILKILVKRIGYTIRLALDETRHTVEWSQVSGDLAANEGFWHLEPFGERGTLAAYGLRIEVGYPVPRTIIDRLTRGSFSALFQAVRQRSTLFT